MKRKLLNNKKGFSLIELLIVIAIMGVLAVIAFSMFSGVLQNSKKKADAQQAKSIEKAVLALIVDSGKVDMTGFHRTYTGGGPSGLSNALNLQNAGWDSLVIALQGVVYCEVNGEVKDFGPYLTPRGDIATSTASSFYPQWSQANGKSGDYVGYQIDVYTSTKSCKVTPTTVVADADVTVH